MVILPPNIRYFSSFLAVSTTDKPVNRNIHAHPPKIAKRFCVKGIYLSWYLQKTRKEFEQFKDKMQKNMWLENTLAHEHLWRGITQIEYSNQKIAQQVWKWWIRLKDKFVFNDLLTKSNRTEIQTYKVEERTFGTPVYISSNDFVRKYSAQLAFPRYFENPF